MILDELLHAIEIEITSSNDITDDIYENIKYVLKIEYGFSSNNVCNYNLHHSHINYYIYYQQD